MKNKSSILGSGIEEGGVRGLFFGYEWGEKNTTKSLKVGEIIPLEGGEGPMKGGEDL